MLSKIRTKKSIPIPSLILLKKIPSFRFNYLPEKKKKEIKDEYTKLQ